MDVRAKEQRKLLFRRRCEAVQRVMHIVHFVSENILLRCAPRKIAFSPCHLLSTVSLQNRKSFFRRNSLAQHAVRVVCCCLVTYHFQFFKNFWDLVLFHPEILRITKTNTFEWYWVNFLINSKNFSHVVNARVDILLLN